MNLLRRNKIGDFGTGFLNDMNLRYITILTLLLIKECTCFCFNYELREAAPKCLQILLPTGANKIDVMKRPIPNIDRFQLKQMCRKLENFETCFQDVVDLCDPSQRKIRILFKSLKESFRYLCDSGLEAFFLAASCLNGDQVTSYLDECSEHSKVGIAKISHSADAIRDEKQNVCHFINEIIACATNVALMNCGPTAKNLTEVVYRKHLNAIYDEWGCSYLSEEDILGITVGGAVVISIAIAISVYCCRRRTVVEPLSSTPGSPTSSTNSRDYANRSVVKLERKSGSGSKDEYKRNYNYNVFDDGFGSLGLRRHPRENMPICLKLGSSRGSDVALG